MTATATVTARQLQFRAAKRDAQQARFAVVAKALGTTEGHSYFTDKQGRKVRDVAFSNVMKTEAVFQLQGNRVVDIRDLLEALGKDCTNYMIAKGYIRKSSCPRQQHLFFVTQAGADNYGLRPLKIDGFSIAWAA